MSDYFAVANILKPPGMTSFDVVAFLKRRLKCRKCGHTGTLDPAASGVLPVCLGKATKIIPYLDEEKKEYIGEITLGMTTDTLDIEGEIIERDANWKGISKNEIEDVFSAFTGVIKQLPPMYSAVHHNGKRLYELAREGKTVKRKSREIKVYELNLLDMNLPKIRFKVKCSRGTYVRTLAYDIGRKLKTSAYLSFLLRSRSGPFYLKDTILINDLEKLEDNFDESILEDLLISPLSVLEYPQIEISKKAEKKASHGACLEKKDLKYPDTYLNSDLSTGDTVVVVNDDKKMISINEVIKLTGSDLKIKPLRVFLNR